MVVAVGVIAGLDNVDVEPSDPTQDHAVVLLDIEFNVTVPPTHIGPLFVGPLDDGIGFTVTVVVYGVVGLQPALLTVSVYVLVTVGVAVGFCAVADDKLVPVHE